MNLEAIKTGVQGVTEILVGTRDTAPHVGSGKIKVLATPVLVMLPEAGPAKLLVMSAKDPPVTASRLLSAPPS